MFRRSLRYPKGRWLVLPGAGIVYALDAFSKSYILNTLAPGESAVLIPGVFQLTRLQNTGAAFSLFYRYPEILTGVAMAFLVGFVLYMWTRKTLAIREILGFSFVVGGAVGNLADRIQLGAVTDFLDFVLINYPVFNVADSFILGGVILLVWEYVQSPRQTAGA